MFGEYFTFHIHHKFITHLSSMTMNIIDRKEKNSSVTSVVLVTQVRKIGKAIPKSVGWRKCFCCARSQVAQRAGSHRPREKSSAHG